jgi:hypothetical protein
MSHIEQAIAHLKTFNLNPDNFTINKAADSKRVYISIWIDDLEKLGSEAFRNFKRAAGGFLSVKGYDENKWLECEVTLSLNDDSETIINFTLYDAVQCEIVGKKESEVAISEYEMNTLDSRINELKEQLETGKKKIIINEYNCTVKQFNFKE